MIEKKAKICMLLAHTRDWNVFIIYQKVKALCKKKKKKCNLRKKGVVGFQSFLLVLNFTISTKNCEIAKLRIRKFLKTSKKKEK